MDSKKAEVLALGIVLLSFALALYIYPAMPERMVSHWNSQGQPDGFMSKDIGLFIMPAINLFLFLLFFLIPKIDPLKENIARFRKYFNIFVILILLMMLYLYSLVLIWNMGAVFDMILALVPALAMLFYYAGVLIEHAERNWFIGIRTPWTISSDVVWHKTHRIGAKLFKLSALIAVIGLFFEEYALWFVLVPVLLSSIYLIVYSYLEFQKEPKAPASRPQRTSARSRPRFPRKGR